MGKFGMEKPVEECAEQCTVNGDGHRPMTSPQRDEEWPWTGSCHSPPHAEDGSAKDCTQHKNQVPSLGAPVKSEAIRQCPGTGHRAHRAQVGSDAEATSGKQKGSHGEVDQGTDHIPRPGAEVHLLLQANLIESMVEKGGCRPAWMCLLVAHDGVERHGTLGVQEEGQAKARGVTTRSLWKDNAMGG